MVLISAFIMMVMTILASTASGESFTTSSTPTLYNYNITTDCLVTNACQLDAGDVNRWVGGVVPSCNSTTDSIIINATIVESTQQPLYITYNGICQFNLLTVQGSNLVLLIDSGVTNTPIFSLVSLGGVNTTLLTSIAFNTVELQSTSFITSSSINNAIDLVIQQQLLLNNGSVEGVSSVSVSGTTVLSSQSIISNIGSLSFGSNVVINSSFVSVPGVTTVGSTGITSTLFYLTGSGSQFVFGTVNSGQIQVDGTTNSITYGASVRLPLNILPSSTFTVNQQQGLSTKVISTFSIVKGNTGSILNLNGLANVEIVDSLSPPTINLINANVSINNCVDVGVTVIGQTQLLLSNSSISSIQQINSTQLYSSINITIANSVSLTGIDGYNLDNLTIVGNPSTLQNVLTVNGVIQAFGSIVQSASNLDLILNTSSSLIIDSITSYTGTTITLLGNNSLAVTHLQIQSGHLNISQPLISIAVGSLVLSEEAVMVIGGQITLSVYGTIMLKDQSMMVISDLSTLHITEAIVTQDNSTIEFKQPNQHTTSITSNIVQIEGDTMFIVGFDSSSPISKPGRYPLIESNVPIIHSNANITYEVVANTINHSDLQSSFTLGVSTLVFELISNVTSSSGDGNQGPSVGVKAGIAIGVASGVALAITFFYLARRAYNKRSQYNPIH